MRKLRKVSQGHVKDRTVIKASLCVHKAIFFPGFCSSCGNEKQNKVFRDLAYTHLTAKETEEWRNQSELLTHLDITSPSPKFSQVFCEAWDVVSKRGSIWFCSTLQGHLPCDQWAALGILLPPLVLETHVLFSIRAPENSTLRSWPLLGWTVVFALVQSPWGRAFREVEIGDGWAAMWQSCQLAATQSMGLDSRHCRPGTQVDSVRGHGFHHLAICVMEDGEA